MAYDLILKNIAKHIILNQKEKNYFISLLKEQEIKKKEVQFAEQLKKENEALKLSIEGHTSNDGSLEANMKLSKARADNVKNYLQTQGINASRLTAQGFGPNKPINKGTTEQAKSQNRRVEMKLSN